LQFRQPLFEKPALWILPRERQRPFVACSCVDPSSESAAEVGSRGMSQPVLDQIAASENRVDDRQAGRTHTSFGHDIGTAD
jgi:hypothetical protein